MRVFAGARILERPRTSMSYAHCPDCGLTISLAHGSTPLPNCPRCIVVRRRLTEMADLTPGSLSVVALGAGGERRLVVAGELDLTTAPRLEAEVADLCRRGVSRLVLDVADLAFVDSRGISAILLSAKRCRALGCSVSITEGQPPIERLFELTGLSRRIGRTAA